METSISGCSTTSRATSLALSPATLPKIRHPLLPHLIRVKRRVWATTKYGIGLAVRSSGAAAGIPGRAGVFRLSDGGPGDRSGDVGFRCTKPIGL